MNPNENNDENAYGILPDAGDANTDVAYTRDAAGIQGADETTPVDPAITVTAEGVVIEQNVGAVAEIPVGDLTGATAGNTSVVTQVLDARLDPAQFVVSNGLSQIVDTGEIQSISNRISMPITRGRVVYYTPGVDDRELYGQKALIAHIAEVYDQDRVNLAVLGVDGRWHRRINVLFVQPGEPKPDTSFVEWMPYQVAQAGIR